MEESTLSSCRGLGILVAASALLGTAVPALADDGGVVGWVESTRGVPLAGAIVSVFGKSIRGGSLVTLSDSEGQFVLTALPPGSYTLRAVGIGHEPSAAQHVTVVANRESLFTFNLRPVGDKLDAAAQAAADEEARREWRWLMRHKRRSVLETTAQEGDAWSGPDAPKASLDPKTKTAALDDLGLLAGNVELVATSKPASSGSDSSNALPGGVGALHLSGRLADGVSWNLGGLVSENEGRSWRTAAQFVIDPGAGHTIEAGAGYAAGELLVAQGVLQPDRAMGGLFVKDHWKLSDRLAANAGARYTYVGFLPDSHHADAVLEIELRGSPQTVVRGSLATRTLAPGGDLLTLSTLASSPAITWARFDDNLRPSHSLRCELGIDHSLGASTQLRARLFDEDTRDLLVTTFDDATPFVRNAGDAQARGFALTVGRRFAKIADGSLTYTFGRARRTGGLFDAPVAAFEEADFHDLVARLETVFESTDTRVVAYYRVNGLIDHRTPVDASGVHNSATATRFDVQLKQGLPFLQPLTRADWELLFAVRNMFHEASEGGFLDELAVQDPPTRLVGGISVRF
ncbi:MAG TPA: TonB-dependent receptor [Vicinamibacteria bacterium]|nr:TonB-dependent receptor [Vicinamibacteria bacterium]